MPHEQSAAYESGVFQRAQPCGQQGHDEARERYDAAARDYAQFVNPHVSDLLERLRLDKCFVRAEGPLLFDAEGNRYLDAVSGYGAVPFGHNPDWVWQAVKEFEQAREPCMVQPSLLPGAGELAEALIRCAPSGLRYVTFGNSGAEAVEAAIKACRLASGKLGILSTENSFHGKTLAALSATGKAFFQEGAGAPAQGFRFIPYGDVDALEEALRTFAGETAAFIVEPIQGEGGVIEAPPGYLKLARRLCDRYGVLLIVDEIQTGLGRTGALFACLSEGVSPDAMTLAKALGGGLLPVSACLLSAHAYSKDFAFKHSSTFAGNALAMRVGLRVIERLTSDDGALLEQVVRQGTYLKQGLCALQRRYGSVIREIRGRGLMLGVELRTDPAMIERGVGAFMAMLGDGLPLFAASYLLNVERVRVAPTLNGSSVLRVQPPLTVTREECDWIIGAFEQLASVMAAGRSDRLVSPVFGPGETASGVFRLDDAGHPIDEGEERVGRFAFIVHLLDSKSLLDFDRSLERLPPSQLEELTSRFEDSARPFIGSQVRIESPAGQAAVGDFIILPKSAAQLLRLSPEDALEEVAAAVRLGRDRGAKIVGLGGYTSVVAQNLRALLKLGVSLTTGNSYTVVAAIDAALEASRITGRKLVHNRAAIVGGGGSIGSALASLLAERVGSLVLVSRENDSGSMRSRYALILARMARHLARRRMQGVPFENGSLPDRLSRLPCCEDLVRNQGRVSLTDKTERRILDEVRGLPIRWTTDLVTTVAQSDLIFLATSSPEPLIRSEMVQPGTVICDLSRPANVSDDLFLRKDVLVIDGGIVEVPGRPNFGFHFGLSPGLAYACMAETVMLALEHHYEHTSLGRDLQESTLDFLRGLAHKHGFRLAELRARQRPIDTSAWRKGSGTSGAPAPQGTGGNRLGVVSVPGRRMKVIDPTLLPPAVPEMALTTASRAGATVGTLTNAPMPD
jgi:acetylornithine/succinyldiaminopimelate/putrescine aminotransferase/predicted amino acid dehydrogenase